MQIGHLPTQVTSLIGAARLASLVVFDGDRVGTVVRRSHMDAAIAAASTEWNVPAGRLIVQEVSHG